MKTAVRKIIKRIISEHFDQPEHRITRKEFDWLEQYADKIFASIGIDVALTKHFKERANDIRNKEQITIGELKEMLNKTLRMHRDALEDGADDIAYDTRKKITRVITDTKTDINAPFVLQWDYENNEVDLVLKTVMRTDNFKTGGVPELTV